ncbi:alpha/beta fold hydrolase [Haloechinothrix sp. LS1_15]|uniref:dienelactone hydrolase family protein n=1 Tax=Haloechinothrix sp. LS1_15 TaxID=2652248 RepID=UPI002945EF4D|nr:alpha/beta fold hydrolase [Haloechinothrix sp. LS1_15]MDV6014053.1 alpha/beta fold hydrolase [Haloechinothrix sp. LS1_15]
MVFPLSVDVGGVTLQGTVFSASRPTGLVVLTQGSGSSRHSPRNRAMARGLQREGFTTLLIDLLGRDEERVDARTGTYRLNVEFLAARLAHVLGKVNIGRGSHGLPVGLFGSARGAAVALAAAARQPQLVRAVVSRGGRPELAGATALSRVRAATLFIVDDSDEHIRELNRSAAKLMVAHEVWTIPESVRLLDDSGALEQVAKCAGDWFSQHLQ